MLGVVEGHRQVLAVPVDRVVGAAVREVEAGPLDVPGEVARHHPLAGEDLPAPAGLEVRHVGLRRRPAVERVAEGDRDPEHRAAAVGCQRHLLDPFVLVGQALDGAARHVDPPDPARRGGQRVFYRPPRVAAARPLALEAAFGVPRDEEEPVRSRGRPLEGPEAAYAPRQRPRLAARLPHDPQLRRAVAGGGSVGGRPWGDRPQGRERDVAAVRRPAGSRGAAVAPRQRQRPGLPVGEPGDPQVGGGAPERVDRGSHPDDPPLVGRDLELVGRLRADHVVDGPAGRRGVADALPAEGQRGERRCNEEAGRPEGNRGQGRRLQRDVEGASQSGGEDKGAPGRAGGRGLELDRADRVSRGRRSWRPDQQQRRTSKT